MKKFLLFLLIFCTMGAVIYAQVQYMAAREANLRADSVEAAADTARLVHFNELNDTINAWQRRVVQTELRADSLDRALQQRPVVRVSAGVRIDTIQVTDTVEVAEVRVDTVRTFQWRGRDGPFVIAGDARIFPARGIFETTVTVPDPIEIGVRINCISGRKINSASVLLTAPDPFDVTPGEVLQDPTICNPPTAPLLSFSSKRAMWAGAGFVAGILTTHLLDDGFRKARYDE